jgi:hypothetical protein
MRCSCGRLYISQFLKRPDLNVEERFVYISLDVWFIGTPRCGEYPAGDFHKMKYEMQVASYKSRLVDWEIDVI